MLGGVAEVYAYGSALSSPEAPCCSHDGDISKACDASSAIFGGFRNPYALPEDFILIAECDENRGPTPLAIIPNGGAKGIDLNSLTLRLLSSDYQGFGATISVPILDTQSLFPDVIPNVHAVVNYFALADLHSRGYVRPMCVAYLSSDKFKLIQTFLSLRTSLFKACRAMKFHNRCVFLQEIEETLQNLSFTKEVRQENGDLSPDVNPTVSRLQEELLEVTTHDLQCIQERLQPLMEEERCEEMKDTETFFRCLEQTDYYKANTHLHKVQWHFQKQASLSMPRTLKLPLRSNFVDLLRPTPFICDIGFLMGLYHLHVTHKYFRRKYENIFVTSREQTNHVHCLKFGACLREFHTLNSNIPNYNGSNCDKYLKLVPASSSDVMQECEKFMDEEYYRLLSNFYSGKSTNYFQRNGLSSSEKFLEAGADPGLTLINGVPSSHPKVPASCFWHGSSIAHLLDIVDQTEDNCPDLGSALDTLQHCNHLPELFYSLLMGQCIVIIGPFECAPAVKALVRMLGTLCPRCPGEDLYVQPWRETATGLKDLEGMALLGMPLLTDNRMDRLVPQAVLAQVAVWNIKTGTFSGLSYKGILLSSVTKRIKSVPSKGPILACLVSFLSDLELKVQVWRAMCQKSNQGSVTPDKYFTSRGYSRNDLDILETLSTMLS